MFQRLRWLWAFLLAAAAAVILRGLAAAFPGPVTDVLSPVNESPWEMGKLAFWPYLCAAMALWRMTPEANFRGGHCLAALSSTAVMIILWGLLWGTVPAYILFSASMGGGMALYSVICKKKWGDGMAWYLAAVLLGVAYVLLTARPLSGGIFRIPGDVSTMGTIPF